MQAEARASIVLPAPAEQVYGHLAAMEAYPSWMRGVRRVVRTGRRRRIWLLEGPAPRWEIEVTVDQPPGRFAFCMEAPGMVGYLSARIYPSGPTCGLNVHQSIHGHGPDGQRLAAWWGDPVRRLRGDLWNLKTNLHERVHGSSDLTRSLSAPSKTSLFSN